MTDNGLPLISNVSVTSHSNQVGLTLDNLLTTVFPILETNLLVHKNKWTASSRGALFSYNIFLQLSSECTRTFPYISKVTFKGIVL
jgi:hypothetical protein